MKVLEFNYQGLLYLQVGQEHKCNHLPMGDYEKLTDMLRSSVWRG